MTDSASATRDLLTSGYIAYSRSVEIKDSAGNKRWDTEYISKWLNQMNIGCINMIPDVMPENMRSRWLILTFIMAVRSNDYSLANRILNPNTADVSSLEKKCTENTHLMQARVAMTGILMDVGLIATPGLSAGRLFLNEVPWVCLFCVHIDCVRWLIWPSPVASLVFMMSATSRESRASWKFSTSLMPTPPGSTIPIPQLRISHITSPSSCNWSVSLSQST
jgi:hypothetical protein